MLSFLPLRCAATDGASHIRLSSELAEARQRSAHWIMREAIRDYVTREELREKFRADALEAWADFQQTGLHATDAEVETGLTSLEADENAPASEPHS